MSSGRNECSTASGRSQQPILISLFAGAGGLDIGLEDAGFKTVVANELEPHACETLRANKLILGLSADAFEVWFAKQLNQKCYRETPADQVNRLRRRLLLGNGCRPPYLQDAKILEGDIRLLPSADLMAAAGVKRGEVDLVAGGPPCQPFSRAGNRETVETETGRLFKEFVRVVNDLRPRWFLFENVKGLILSKTDVLHVKCLDCRKEAVAPFDARLNVLAEKVYGVPCPKCSSQKTKLIWNKKAGGSLDIILNEFEGIGYKCRWAILNAADFGVPQMRERLFIVGSRDGEGFTWPTGHFGEASNEDNKQPSLFDDPVVQKQPWVTMYDALWSKGHWRYGRLDLSRAVLWVKNVVRPHDEPVTWTLERPSPTIGAHQGAKLAVAPNGVPEEQLRRQQWHVLGRRQGDFPPVEVEHEYLSDDELSRLQTFPPHWYFFGTRMERAFQIGNAVPPVLAAAVGSSIRRAILKAPMDAATA